MENYNRRDRDERFGGGNVRAIPGRRLRTGDGDAPMPSDPELEADALGCLLSGRGGSEHLLSLDGGCFHDPILRRLYEAMSALALRGRATTPAVICVELGTDGVEAIGGREFLTALASRGAGLETSFPRVASELRALSARRAAIAAAQELISRALDPKTNPDEAISACSRRLIEGMATGGSATMRRKSQVSASAIDERLGAGAAITTGIVAFDPLLMGGLRPRTFVVVESEYAKGKTALCSTIADNLNAADVKVLYITCESSAEDIELRMVARRLGVRLEWTYDETHPGFAKLRANRDAYVERMPDNVVYVELKNPTVDDIHREILRAKHRYGVRVAFLDYVQCIGGFEKGMKEETFWYDVGYRLRSIAKEEDLCVFAVAQADKRTAQALRETSTLLLRLHREENDSGMHFTTEKSNDGPYGSTERSASPSILLDPCGPHVRDAVPEDHSDLGRKAGESI
jgi:replicative DNA helicase